MRRPLPIRMYIPSEALLIISSEKRNKNPELYVYIIYSLTINSNIYKNRSDYKCFEGYAPLNHDNFFKLSGKKSQSYISFLKKNCIIEADNIQIPKKKRFYFRINPNIFSNEFQKASIFELTSDTKLFHNLVNEHRNSNSNFCKLPNHLYLMQKKFFKIIYNNTQAEDWVFKNVTDVNKMYSYLNSINKFYDKRFRYFKRNKTNNRLDTNLTNLKKELRNFIVGNYISIDLRNSQPFFLAILILYIIDLSFKNRKNELEDYKKVYPLCCHFSFIDFPVPLDNTIFLYISKIRNFFNFDFFTNFSDFFDSTSNGTFYDDFVKFNNNIDTRKEIKDMMFKVLFSKESSYKKEKLMFSKRFPYINQIVNIIKRKKHNTLAILLQKIESYIFIDVISKKLVESGIIPFTVHDSIIVEENNSENALKIISAVFSDMFGVIPSFSIEKLSA